MSISLKSARVNAEMTRPEVIKRLDEDYNIKISVNTLANYESKKKRSRPDINTGKALASIYGIILSVTLPSKHFFQHFFGIFKCFSRKNYIIIVRRIVVQAP